jgi:hypothetical protein
LFYTQGEDASFGAVVTTGRWLLVAKEDGPNRVIAKKDK